MSYNPQFTGSPEFALPAYRVLRLSGRDAVAFAQGQFMNDVAALADRQWQWSGWLNPKGRVVALFALLRLDAETLWLAGAGDMGRLADELRRYVFRSKVAIELPDGISAVGRLGPPHNASGAFSKVDGPTDIELDLGGEAGPRSLILRAGNDVRLEGPDRSSDWFALDVAHGWPGVPGADLQRWTPQQLSLERLNAFSVRKGCYPGQEIVARTHFLGRSKRGIRRLTGGAPIPGALVSTAGEQSLGEVVCVSGGNALAVMPFDIADTVQMTVGGVHCAVLPLATGLER